MIPRYAGLYTVNHFTTVLYIQKLVARSIFFPTHVPPPIDGVIDAYLSYYDRTPIFRSLIRIIREVIEERGETPPDLPAGLTVANLQPPVGQEILVDTYPAAAAQADALWVQLPNDLRSQAQTIFFADQSQPLRFADDGTNNTRINYFILQTGPNPEVRLSLSRIIWYTSEALFNPVKEVHMLNAMIRAI